MIYGFAKYRIKDGDLKLGAVIGAVLCLPLQRARTSCCRMYCPPFTLCQPEAASLLISPFLRHFLKGFPTSARSTGSAGSAVALYAHASADMGLDAGAVDGRMSKEDFSVCTGRAKFEWRDLNV